MMSQNHGSTDIKYCQPITSYLTGKNSLIFINCTYDYKTAILLEEKKRCTEFCTEQQKNGINIGQ